MKIEHIAIWTQDLERLKDFYVTYFEAQANDKYVNPTKGFESYFLSFTSGARLELMSLPDVQPAQTLPATPRTPPPSEPLPHATFRRWRWPRQVRAPTSCNLANTLLGNGEIISCLASTVMPIV